MAGLLPGGGGTRETVPISVLVKGCSKARQLDSHFVGGGRRLGWVDGEERCLEGLASTLLGGGVEGRGGGSRLGGRWEKGSLGALWPRPGQA